MKPGIDMGELVNRIVRESLVDGDGKKESCSGVSENDKGFVRAFNTHPSHLIAELKKKVIGQEVAIRALATAICGHYNTIRYRLEKGENPMKDVDRIKENILMIGSTGVGKTYLLKLIAQILGVPFLKVAANTYSEAGYVGGDVQDMVRELAESTRDAQGNIDIQLAQFGIIFVDEIDKIASAGKTQGPDVSRQGVQRALLSIIEETDVDLKTKQDISEQIRMANMAAQGKEPERRVVNTRNILFIFAGVFPQLDDVFAKKTKTGIGFGADVKKAETTTRSERIKGVTDLDLVECGFESEFIGRIPIRVMLDDLSSDDLFQILSRPGSPIVDHFVNTMASYGISVTIDESVLRHVADQAAKSSTGARSLLSAFNAVTEPFKCHLPDIPVSEFRITKEFIDGTYDPLVFLGELLVKANDKLQELAVKKNEELVASVSLNAYATYILEKNGLSLEFDQGAIQYVKDFALRDSLSEVEFCRKTFSEFESAFLYLKSIGIKSLTLSADAFSDPKVFLENAFKKNKE